VELGVGRTRKDDVIDPGAGVVIEAPVGAEVRQGEIMAVVFARNPELCDRGVARLRGAWRVTREPSARSPHVLYRVDRAGARATA